MWRSSKRIWAVALLTGTEGLRQPAFFLLFALAAGLTAFSPGFAFFHLGEEAKMVADLGLSTILMCATLLALLTASSTVSDEIEGRTALTMLAKPLRRTEFLLGKYFGIVLSSGALVLLASVVLLATLRSQRYEPAQDPLFAVGIASGLAIGLVLFGGFLVTRLMAGRGLSLVSGFWLAYAAASAFVLIFLARSSAAWEWRMVAGLFFIFLHTCVIAAAAVALATRCTLVQAALGTAVFFLVGHASGALVAPFRDSSHHLSLAGTLLRAILPDLDQFNVADALATGFLDKPVTIPWDVLCGSSLYALLYGGALLVLATLLFQRRELG